MTKSKKEKPNKPITGCFTTFFELFMTKHLKSNISMKNIRHIYQLHSNACWTSGMITFIDQIKAIGELKTPIWIFCLLGLAKITNNVRKRGINKENSVNLNRMKKYSKAKNDCNLSSYHYESDVDHTFSFLPLFPLIASWKRPKIH